MRTSGWQVERHRATIACGGFRAEVDVRLPGDGIEVITLSNGNLAPVRLLAIESPSAGPSRNVLLEDAYARGPELAATYQGTDAWPVRVDALWRAIAPAGKERFPAAFELVVSVRTEVLDSRPQLTVRSALAVAEAARLADPQSGRFVPLAITSQPQELAPGGGPGCVLLRTPAGPSYVEMVHPVDFHQSQWQGATGVDAPSVLRHWLFPERLEKGVILRARVRGAFLPREGDEQLAARCYAEFATSEPPLGN